MNKIMASAGRIFLGDPKIAKPKAIGTRGATIARPGIRRVLASIKREVSFAIRSRILRGDDQARLVLRHATDKIDRRMNDFLACLKDGRPVESAFHSLSHAAQQASDLHLDSGIERVTDDLSKLPSQYIVDAFARKCLNATGLCGVALDTMPELLATLKSPHTGPDASLRHVLNDLFREAYQRFNTLIDNSDGTLDSGHAMQLMDCADVFRRYGADRLADKIKEKVVSFYLPDAVENIKHALKGLKQGDPSIAAEEKLIAISEFLEKIAKVDVKIVDDLIFKGIQTVLEDLPANEVIGVLYRVSSEATLKLRGNMRNRMASTLEADALPDNARSNAGFVTPLSVLSSIRAAVSRHFETRTSDLDIDYPECSSAQLTTYANLFRSYNLHRYSKTIDAEIVKRVVPQIAEQVSRALDAIAEQATPVEIETEFRVLAELIDGVDKKVATSDKLLGIAFAEGMKTMQLADMIALLDLVSPDNTAALRALWQDNRRRAVERFDPQSSKLPGHIANNRDTLDHEGRTAANVYKMELRVDKSTPSSLLEIFISEPAAFFSECYSSRGEGLARFQAEVARLDYETLAAYFKVLRSHNLEPQTRALDEEARRRSEAAQAE